MSLSKAETLTKLKHDRLRPSIGVLQHACYCGEMSRRNCASPLFSPEGHWRGERFIPSQHYASTFLHPFAPRALPRISATMGALTPVREALRTRSRGSEHLPWPGQVSLVNTTRTSLHSVTNHPTHPVIASLLPSQRDRLPEPGLRPATPLPCRGLANLWQTSCFRPCPGLDFAINEQARRYVGPNRVRFTTDCKFASGCSPPRLAATQLPLAIGRGHLPREDLHLSDRACSQAHSFPKAFVGNPDFGLSEAGFPLKNTAGMTN
jgi:hypothetical protein